MQYQALMLLGEEAPAFLEQWDGGGIAVGEDAAALFYAARGAHSLAKLRQAGALWELAEAQFDLKALMAVGLRAPWRWQRLAWPEASGRAELPDYGRLQRLIEAGAQQNGPDILRLAVGLGRRLGPPQHIKGRVAGDGAPESQGDTITLYASGIVSYGRTPHPLPFMQSAAREAKAKALQF